MRQSEISEFGEETDGRCVISRPWATSTSPPSKEAVHSQQTSTLTILTITFTDTPLIRRGTLCCITQYNLTLKLNSSCCLQRQCFRWCPNDKRQLLCGQRLQLRTLMSESVVMNIVPPVCTISSVLRVEWLRENSVSSKVVATKSARQRYGKIRGDYDE